MGVRLFVCGCPRPPRVMLMASSPVALTFAHFCLEMSETWAAFSILGDKFRAEEMAQMVRWLCKDEDLGLNPQHSHKSWA